jgi:hypothetical protein
MLQMETGITSAEIMSHPLIVMVNVRGFRMPLPVVESVALLCAARLASVRLRTALGTVSAPDVQTTAVMLLASLRERCPGKQ